MYIKRIILIISLLGVLAASIFTYKIYTVIFTPNTAFKSEQASIFIPTNTRFTELLTKLNPLLKNVENFTMLASRKGYTNNIKAGKYLIKKGMNNNDIINTLRSNNTPVKVTFNNQETVAKLAGRIAKQIEADSLSLLNAFNDEGFLNANNFNKKNALTMYIPNSYQFFWNTSATAFRNRMLSEYKQFWNKNRLEKAAKVNLSPEEVIALAAIVQKETAKVDERSRIAGVYLNRLKKRMPLQADPTVAYAIKETLKNPDTIIKRILLKDLKIDSKYNTYKYRGLPPGPIIMPDISTIEAVLNPEKHNYLYFVADVNRPGYHLFAKTLTSHNNNRSRYIKWLNKQRIYR